jgi:hypothetical protein
MIYVFRDREMRSRRLRAEWLGRTARLRRIIGALLIFGGTLLWGVGVAAALPVRERYFGVIVGGALVVLGIVLIATSV